MAGRVLLTGSNRGIGLALTTEFLAAGYTVIATCRKPAAAVELHALERKHRERMEVMSLDVNSDESVARAVAEVSRGHDGLEVLFNNAGINPRSLYESISELDFEDFHRAFETNSIGPVRVSRAFLPLLLKGRQPKVVNMSSGLGEITRLARADISYAYGVSKAALNFLTRNLALELKDRGVIVVAMTPGWVRTDMGGPKAAQSATETARGIVGVVNRLSLADTGQWFTWKGEVRKYW